MDINQSTDSQTEVIATDGGGAVWGYLAFVTGALALSVIAIVAGHLSLAKTSRAKATARAFGVAGTVLGYVALVATGAGVYMWMYGPQVQGTQDAQVQSDVIAMGSAIAHHVIDSDDVPEVAVSDTHLIVAGASIERASTTATALSLEFHGPHNWCVSLTSPGSDVEGYSYRAQEGLIDGLRCAP